MKPSKKIPLEDVPLDVLRAILRLEAKREWRENWEKRIDAADAALDRQKENLK